MPQSMKELSFLVLLVLTCVCESKPLERSRRTIVKDYFNPLTYPTDKVQFEKGEDGKYHEHSTNSRFEYATSEASVASNEIFGEASKPSEAEDDVFESPDSTSLSSGVPKFELQKENLDLATKIVTPEEEKEEKVVVPEAAAKLDSELKPEDAVNKGLESSAKLDIPIDSKWSLVPKPDGKDEKPFVEGSVAYLPEPPVVPEEKKDDGTVGIGQIPKYHPVLVPPGVPMLIPKRISSRVLSLLPKIPAIDISDRLPQHEVIEESSETAVVENISPRGPTLVKEERRFVGNHFFHPLLTGLQLPFFPAAKVLKEAVDEEKLEGLAESEIVDIAGHKMLFQKKILVSPHHDPSRMHISVMSLQPVENVDPEVLKDLDMEKKELEKELTLIGKKEAGKRSLKGEEIDAAVEEGEETGDSAEAGEPGKRRVFYHPYLVHRLPAETSVVKKPEVSEEKTVEAKMPPPKDPGHTIPAVEGSKKDEAKDLEGIFPTPKILDSGILVEEGKGEERKVVDTKGLEAEIKGEEAEKAKGGHVAEESGLKTEIQAESDLEKDKGLKNLPILPVDKIEEETTLMVKEAKELSIVPEVKKEKAAKETTHTVKEGKDLSIAEEDKKEETTLMVKEVKDLPIVPEEKKEEEKTSIMVEEERDLLIGTEDLLKFRNEMKTQTRPVSAESGVDLKKEELEFDEESGTKDAEVAESKSVEVKLKPEEESMYSLEKAISEGKKGIWKSEEAAVASHDEKELTGSKDTGGKTDVLEVEAEDYETKKVVAGGEKSGEEKLSTEHSGAEIATTRDAKEKTGVKKMKSENKSKKTEGKRGVAAAHVATASEGKTQVKNHQHSEESNPDNKDVGLTESEGSLLEERKKKYNEGKDEASSKKKKCEDSEESDSEDEEDIH